MEYYVIFIALFLLVIIPAVRRRRRIAAIGHILNRKKQNKEIEFMKELAQKFIGKECLVYTVASDSSAVKGTIKEITDNRLRREFASGKSRIRYSYPRVAAQEKRQEKRNYF